MELDHTKEKYEDKNLEGRSSTKRGRIVRKETK